MYMELSSHPRILEKKIKPVAVPVGFKVVNGSRRIGKQQAVSRPELSLKGRAASLAAALVEALAAALEAALAGR